MKQVGKAETGWLVAIIALGLLLRCVGLGWESVWYDEADSLRLASIPAAELLSGKELTPGNPNGFFLLLRLWCLGFGFSIESARAFSALAGTLAIPCVWWLAKRASTHTNIAIIASLLTALNPALVFLGREARVFALLSTLITMATFFLLEIVEDDSKRAWFGLTFVSAFALYMHYGTFFFLAAVPWPILWSGRAHLKQTIIKLLLFYFGVGVAFLPLLPLFIRQLLWETSREVDTWILHAIYFPVYAIGGRTLVWKQDGMSAAALAEAIVVFLVLLPLLLRNDWSKPFSCVATAVVVGVPFAAIIVSLVLSPVFNGRYVSFVLPCLMVALAIGIQRNESLKNWRGWVPVSTLGLLMLFSLFRLYTGVHKDDWRGLAEYVSSHGPEQPIVFYEGVGYLPYSYYRPEQLNMRIQKKFDAVSHAWETEGYLEQMKTIKDFWLAISPEQRDPSYSEIMDWLNDNFQQVDDQRFRGLHLLRFQAINPSSGVAVRIERPK